MITLNELHTGYKARTNNPEAPQIYAVGKAGTSYAGQTGSKAHVLIAHSFGTEAACGARNNGGNRVTVIPGLDTDRVSCTKCQSWLARAEARLREEGSL